MLETTTCRDMMTRARASARTEALCFDGSMKGLMNELYQVPFGRTKSPGEDPVGSQHVIGSLLCPDGVLECRCGGAERDALLGCLGTLPRRDCKVFFTDRPADYDGDPEVELLLNAAVHAMDPMHVAIRVEGASGERPTALSRALRRALLPLGLRQSDGHPPSGSRKCCHT